MDLRETLRPDATLSALTQGYAWIPDLLRREGGAPVTTRFLGRRAVVLHGADAARFFYDERHVVRRAALPGPVVDTLFGRGAVHTLDGESHRVRKALLVSLLKDEAAVGSLAESAGTEWDLASRSWAASTRTELFTETARVITRAVCSWAGMPLGDAEVPAVADDLVAMVDGFATAGPRHWRARQARARQEARIAELIEAVRDDAVPDEDGAPRGSALRAVALHQEAGGRPLDTHTAAVEVLNIVRPTAAVAWYLTFAAHALHRWPQHRDALRTGDPAYAEAFTHEVRRFYPFVPFVVGLAAADVRYEDAEIAEGTLIVLDVYGHQHDPALWPHPYAFDPARFTAGPPADPYALIPQGGGDAATGHRCPGEDVTVALLATLAVRLARLEYEVPAQDLSIPLSRIPTRPADGFVIDVRSAPEG
ncbi:cytochrome P450 [Streptomyces sp. PKU-EA00015]|uniref:cytochrome P450 n=1 Tax=Streptomyces sp. PKU-EA00015 TaxID=2748326 RepID=UPI0015A23479|nr:cytochrome P450 [Streptomyces sp. PKU-EA00015]NWF25392.1 cytochrome P450 [Streptomyces sp. PKU-EA00015]